MKISTSDSLENKKFEYIYFKTKQISSSDIFDGNEKSEKTLVQMVDVSHKMLYNKVKAKKQFLEIINATVSHELRNPLSSLVGQALLMDQFLNQFKEILAMVKDKQLKRQMIEIL